MDPKNKNDWNIGAKLYDVRNHASWKSLTMNAVGNIFEITWIKLGKSEIFIPIIPDRIIIEKYSVMVIP